MGFYRKPPNDWEVEHDSEGRQIIDTPEHSLADQSARMKLVTPEDLTKLGRGCRACGYPFFFYGARDWVWKCEACGETRINYSLVTVIIAKYRYVGATPEAAPSEAAPLIIIDDLAPSYSPNPFNEPPHPDDGLCECGVQGCNYNSRPELQTTPTECPECGSTECICDDDPDLEDN